MSSDHHMLTSDPCLTQILTVARNNSSRTFTQDLWILSLAFQVFPYLLNFAIISTRTKLSSIRRHNLHPTNSSLNITQQSTSRFWEAFKVINCRGHRNASAVRALLLGRICACSQHPHQNTFSHPQLQIQGSQRPLLDSESSTLMWPYSHWLPLTQICTYT